MKDKFDQVLREALSEEEKELWDDLLEASPLQLVTDNFRSRNRWLNILGMAVGVVFMVLGVLTLIQFVEAEETLAAIRWGLAFIMCMWGLWAVKLWSWMEIQRNALTREIKRLELQVVHLGAKLSGDQAQS